MVRAQDTLYVEAPVRAPSKETEEARDLEVESPRPAAPVNGKTEEAQAVAFICASWRASSGLGSAGAIKIGLLLARAKEARVVEVQTLEAQMEKAQAVEVRMEEDQLAEARLEVKYIALCFVLCFVDDHLLRTFDSVGLILSRVVASKVPVRLFAVLGVVPLYTPVMWWPVRQCCCMGSHDPCAHTCL